MTNNHDGTYTVKYTPTQNAPLATSVSHYGDVVQGSPFAVEVKEGARAARETHDAYLWYALYAGQGTLLASMLLVTFLGHIVVLVLQLLHLVRLLLEGETHHSRYALITQNLGSRACIPRDKRSMFFF